MNMCLKFPMTKSLSKILKNCTEILIQLLESCSYEGVLHLHVSNLICCKCTIKEHCRWANVPLGVHAPQVGNLCYTVLVQKAKSSNDDTS